MPETTGAAVTTDAPTTTARATTTSAAPATTEPAITPSTIPATSGYVPGADPDADAAALAWTTAFDSTTGYDAKAAVIADAEALRPTIEAYTPAGEVVGGITLEPTNVVITGDTAAITYKVAVRRHQPATPSRRAPCSASAASGSSAATSSAGSWPWPGTPAQLMTDLEARFDTAVELTVEDQPPPARLGRPQRRARRRGRCWPSGSSSSCAS